MLLLCLRSQHLEWPDDKARGNLCMDSHIYASVHTLEIFLCFPYTAVYLQSVSVALLQLWILNVISGGKHGCSILCFPFPTCQFIWNLSSLWDLKFHPDSATGQTAVFRLMRGGYTCISRDCRVHHPWLWAPREISFLCTWPQRLHLKHVVHRLRDGEVYILACLLWSSETAALSQKAS